MDTFYAVIDYLFQIHKGVWMIFLIMFAVASVGQWMLYEKAKQPGIAIFIPFWNFIAFLKIVGRPASHMWLFFIPFYNVYFAIVVWIEIAQSFGKTKMSDYLSIIFLNGIYLVQLGLEPDAKYIGPAYSIKKGNKEGRTFLFPDENNNVLSHHNLA